MAEYIRTIIKYKIAKRRANSEIKDIEILGEGFPGYARPEDAATEAKKIQDSYETTPIRRGIWEFFPVKIVETVEIIDDCISS